MKSLLKTLFSFLALQHNLTVRDNLAILNEVWTSAPFWHSCCRVERELNMTRHYVDPKIFAFLKKTISRYLNAC